MGYSTLHAGTVLPCTVIPSSSRRLPLPLMVLLLVLVLLLMLLVVRLQKLLLGRYLLDIVLTWESACVHRRRRIKLLLKRLLLNVHLWLLLPQLVRLLAVIENWDRLQQYWLAHCRRRHVVVPAARSACKIHRLLHLKLLRLGLEHRRLLSLCEMELSRGLHAKLLLLYQMSGCVLYRVNIIRVRKPHVWIHPWSVAVSHCNARSCTCVR